MPADVLPWLVLALGITPARAGSDVLAQSWAVLEELDRSGYAEAAAAEVLKALVAAPGDPEAPAYRLRLSRYQRRVGHLVGEVATLERARELHPELEAWWDLALVDAALQREDFAGVGFALLDARRDPETRDALRMYEAWGHVGTERRAEAIAALSGVTGPLSGAATAFRSDLEAHWDAVPRRSPFGAGALSVVPGAGHAYVGRPVQGLLYLGVVGGTAYGAWTLHADERPVLAGLLGALAVATWGQAVIDAVAEASRFNRRARASRLRDYQHRHWIEARPGTDARPLEVVPSGGR